MEETDLKKKTIEKLSPLKLDDMILRKKFISKKNQISNQQPNTTSFKRQIVQGIRKFFSPSNFKYENGFIFKTPSNKNKQKIEIDPPFLKNKIDQLPLYQNLEEKLSPPQNKPKLKNLINRLKLQNNLLPSLFISKLNPKRMLKLKRKMKSVYHILTFMSIFKSKKTIRQNNFQIKRNRQLQGIFPLKPTNQFRQIWNITLIFMLILTAILTPIRVCIIDDQDFHEWFGFDLFFDIYFWIDMLMNFLSCYYDTNNQLICTFKEIFIYYIFGWFPIDFIALFPFDKISGGDQQFQKLFRLLRLMRLNKIGTTNSLVNQLFQMNVGLQKILNMIVIMLTTSHITACLFYFTARLSEFEEDTWVVRLGLQDTSYFMKYITALYWCFQTLTTVGYGDIGSVTMMERILSIFYMFFGVGFYSMTLNDLTNLIQGMDVEAAILNNLKKDFQEINLYCEIPILIQWQVNGFFEQNCKKNELWGINTNAYRKQLGHQLYEEFSLLMRRELVGSINIFLVDAKFTANIFWNLQYYKLQKDELIYREGDPRDEIFFLLKGQVCYLNGEAQELLQIKQGDMVGDIEVIQNQKRYYSAATKTDCTLLICNTQIFMNLYEQFTSVQIYIKRQIKMKMKKINKTKQLLKQQNKLEMASSIKLNGKDSRSRRKLNKQLSMPNHKNQIKRIQNFSCLYLADNQEEILKPGNKNIIKSSKEHFQLLSDRLKFKREIRLKLGKEQFEAHMKRQNQELKDKTITSNNAPAELKTNNSSIIFPMNIESSFIHNQSNIDLLESFRSVRFQEQQMQSTLVNKANFKTNTQQQINIKSSLDKIIQQSHRKNLSISKNLPELIVEQDEQEENRQTEINITLGYEEKDLTEKHKQIDQQSIQQMKITRIKNRMAEFRNNGIQFHKKSKFVFKYVKEVNSLIKSISEIQIKNK